MASRDVGGKSAGKNLSKAFDKARLIEELESEQESNIEVGDFVSELATAVKFRMKSGLGSGDWIEEPERAFTDGLIFGREEAVAADVKLQISVCMDASTSMWVNRIMRHAGPTFIALDRIIRKAALDLPEGAVLYKPFIFHGSAHPIPASYLNSYVGRITGKADAEREVWPTFPRNEQIVAAREAGEIEPHDSGRIPLSGEDTRIAPLFRAIQAWEKDNDSNAFRLDLVITDGVLENAEDVAEATAVQEQRNGRLQTVLLNFLPVSEWSGYHLPDRCAQYPVTPDNLNTAIRAIVQEAVNSLL